jgi:hypothetical protein
MDNQDDRICMVFGLTSDDPLPYDSMATELTYFNFFKANLTFPFPARFFDPIKDCHQDVTVIGMCDESPVDDGFGVICVVLDGTEKRQMPLSELKVPADNINHQFVDDYITWFVNSPEDGVDEDVDGDWDEDDDEEWGDEDEYWDDEQGDLDDDDERGYDQEPPVVRQKTGRNDPCPCGSGRKFKKCCLKKQSSDTMLN